jgi:hypothetical protein
MLMNKKVLCLLVVSIAIVLVILLSLLGRKDGSQEEVLFGTDHSSYDNVAVVPNQYIVVFHSHLMVMKKEEGGGEEKFLSAREVGNDMLTQYYRANNNQLSMDTIPSRVVYDYDNTIQGVTLNHVSEHLFQSLLNNPVVKYIDEVCFRTICVCMRRGNLYVFIFQEKQRGSIVFYFCVISSLCLFFVVFFLLL